MITKGQILNKLSQINAGMTRYIPFFCFLHDENNIGVYARQPSEMLDKEGKPIINHKLIKVLTEGTNTELMQFIKGLEAYQTAIISAGQIIRDKTRKNGVKHED